MVFASCDSNSGKVAEETASEREEVATEAMLAADADAELIREYYERSVFGGDQEFALANSTPKLIDELRKANDYDDNSLALWMMRSEAQDGDDVQEVKSVTPESDSWYAVAINDMGREITVHVMVAEHKIADFVR